MCMDVMVSMDVMTTVFLLHDRLLSMLLLMCGCMYFGVMITMDVVVAATTRPRRVSCARSWPGRLVHASILFWLRRLLCMDVTVGVGVMMAVLLQHD